MAYVDAADFRLLTPIPSADLDTLEAAESGAIVRALTAGQGYVDARLRKRYVVPLATPVPEPVKAIVSAVATRLLYAKIGVQASSEVAKFIADDFESSMKFLRELADGADGLAELPLRADLPTDEGVSKGGPLASTGASAYAWLDDEGSYV